eukprot:scaffold704_cov419-Pavlova_lutheri.AAC.2
MRVRGVPSCKWGTGCRCRLDGVLFLGKFRTSNPRSQPSMSVMQVQDRAPDCVARGRPGPPVKPCPPG